MTTGRYVEHAAIVSGGAAWLLSRILRSPAVAKLTGNPPAWLDRSEISATVNAIHHAAKAFEVASTAHERENATVVGAVDAQSDPTPEWTVSRAADHLRLSPRRVQELAPELGGRRVGRQWILNELAVREYRRWREDAA